MAQVIIYRQNDGTVAIIWPIPEALAIHGIDAIAKKDVPEGKPYKIMDSAALPADRTSRNAWMVQDVDLTDGVGAPGNSFEQVAP